GAGAGDLPAGVGEVLGFDDHPVGFHGLPFSTDREKQWGLLRRHPAATRGRRATRVFTPPRWRTTRAPAAWARISTRWPMNLVTSTAVPVMARPPEEAGRNRKFKSGNARATTCS